MTRWDGTSDRSAMLKLLVSFGLRPRCYPDDEVPGGQCVGLVMEDVQVVFLFNPDETFRDVEVCW